MTVFYAFLISAILFISCKDSVKLNREKSTLDEYVFYGKVGDIQKDSLIDLLSAAMEKAFSIEPINLSPATKEIRIYYGDVWSERFYIERFENDSIEVELYKCRSDRRNDSIFMIIKERIRATGKYDVRDITNVDSLPDLKDCQPKDTAVYLDKGYAYFIETKSGQSFKKILVNDNCLMIQNDKEVTCIINFLHSLSKSLNFNFSDTWQQIDSAAFKTN